MTDEKVSDDLWEEFHRVVNMTSRELGDWLRVESADENAEELPDHSGRSLGRRVLAILGKRRGDLTDDDVAAMGKVVETVHGQRRDDLEPTAGDEHWRHRLMDIGHDPLQEPRG
jgi:hypothetical protein